MKHLFLLLISCITFSCAIAYAEAPKKLAIQVGLTYTEQDENGQLKEYRIENTLKTSSNNQQWTAIQTKSAIPFLVLSKIESATQNDITIKFLILDADIKPQIISAPKLKMTYGQPSQVAMEANHQKVSLTVTTTIR